MKAWHLFLLGVLSVLSIGYAIGSPEIAGELVGAYVIFGGIGLAIYYFIKPKPKDKIPINK